MQYILRCECGRQMVVTAGVPDMTITCGCGRVLSLDDGRRIGNAGFERGDSDTADFWRTVFQLTPRCYVTPILFWLNIAVFAVMVLSGVHPFQPTSLDLVKWGALFGPWTLGGEYWRMLTCTFLHIGVLHLACNMWALWSAGTVVERLVGPTGFLILYLLSGLAGSMASLFWNPMVLSAGASGAIFGVFGALFGFFLLSRHTVPPRVLERVRSSGISLLILSVVTTLAVRVDLAAHLGGLAAGFCCGLALSQPVTLEARSGRLVRNLLLAAGGAAVLAGAFMLLPKPTVSFILQ